VRGVRVQGADGEEQDSGVGEGGRVGVFIGWVRGGRGRGEIGRGGEDGLPIVGCGVCEMGLW
jgi:hypothetical protein